MKYFMKAIENFFRVYIATSKQDRGFSGELGVVLVSYANPRNIL